VAIAIALGEALLDLFDAHTRCTVQHATRSWECTSVVVCLDERAALALSVPQPGLYGSLSQLSSRRTLRRGGRKDWWGSFAAGRYELHAPNAALYLVMELPRHPSSSVAHRGGSITYAPEGTFVSPGLCLRARPSTQEASVRLWETRLVLPILVFLITAIGQSFECINLLSSETYVLSLRVRSTSFSTGYLKRDRCDRIVCSTELLKVTRNSVWCLSTVPGDTAGVLYTVLLSCGYRSSMLS
jgi:hypothetical protein